MSKSPSTQSPLFIWFCGTAASVVLTWIVSSMFAHAGHRFLLRYWAIGIGTGSVSSAVAALVATRPTQQSAAKAIQKSAESIEMATERFQQTGEVVSHSMNTLLNAVGDQADRTQQLGTWLQQMYEASRSDQHAEITATTQPDHADRHPTTPSSASNAVPHSRIHSPGSASSFSAEETESDLEFTNLLGGNDFGFGNDDVGDLWGSQRTTEPSDRRAS